VILGFTILASVAKAENPRPSPVSDTCGDEFNNKLIKCERFECRMPHPFQPGFVITKRISGLEGALCHTDQTAPPAMLYDCKYSQDSIAYLVSKEVRDATKAGKPVKIRIGPNGTEASVDGAKLRQDFAKRECRSLVDETAIRKLDENEQASVRKIARLLEESRLREISDLSATPTP
jgi:hypothetical protein